ncbi:histidine phosphatase family protein [Paenibacillus sp. FSL H8-0034]|uniref:histidine phosphatase family protein n=1 Tax=Paenibacillus sp. FSL H8-0034 TaxID=2954671 RepID=UPI0030F6A1B2
MNPTIISLIRHGVTDVNREPIFQGQMNNPLAIEGTRQAQLLAARLSFVKVDVLYSSDLLRAVQTAAIIVKPHDKEIRTSSQLREINRGDWTGMSYKACAAADPAGWQASRINPEFRSPGGESFVDLHKRVVTEIERIAMLHRGTHIVIVTHGGPIRAFLRHAVGLPAHHMQTFEAANTSISRFKLEDQQWSLLQFNDHAHLEPNSFVSGS